jgi:hypothetical protein
MTNRMPSRQRSCRAVLISSQQALQGDLAVSTILCDKLFLSMISPQPQQLAAAHSTLSTARTKQVWLLASKHLSPSQQVAARELQAAAQGAFRSLDDGSHPLPPATMSSSSSAPPGNPGFTSAHPMQRLSAGQQAGSSSKTAFSGTANLDNATGSRASTLLKPLSPSAAAAAADQQWPWQIDQAAALRTSLAPDTTLLTATPGAILPMPDSGQPPNRRSLSGRRTGQEPALTSDIMQYLHQRLQHQGLPEGRSSPASLLLAAAGFAGSRNEADSGPRAATSSAGRTGGQDERTVDLTAATELASALLHAAGLDSGASTVPTLTSGPQPYNSPPSPHDFSSSRGHSQQR